MQFLNHGFTGEANSGQSTKSDMFAVVVDSCIDGGHAAWWDDAAHTKNRLGTIWRQNVNAVWGSTNGAGCVPPSGGTASHGTRVAGHLAGSLLRGQDSAFSGVDTDAQRRRTGLAVDATFDFVEAQDELNAALEFLRTLNADVVNVSLSVDNLTPEYCGTGDPAVHAVDDLFLDNTLVVTAASGDGTSSGCRVKVPATAAGALTVGAYDPREPTVADLKANSVLETFSPTSASPDHAELVFMDLVAASGPTDIQVAPGGYDTTPEVGTSMAAPIVSGGALLLKDNMRNELGAGGPQETVELLLASLLLMGDNELSSGSPGPGDPPDSRWGMGRLKLRMFGDAGMDSPSRVRFCVREVDDNSVVDACDPNPNANGVNQVLDSSADHLKVVAAWFEPNIGPQEAPAEMGLSLAWQAAGGGSWTNVWATGSPIGRARVQAQGVGNKKWRVFLTGLDVPASTRVGYFRSAGQPGLPTRRVGVVVAWEGDDRSDPEGPDGDVEPLFRP